MGCNKVVRLGSGRYSSSGSQPPYCWDGHKYACEDDFKEEEPCLVYTFGVFNDASFEEVMAAKEICRIQSGGKPPGRDTKFVDVYHEKPIRLTVRALVPVKEHPKFNFVGKLLGPKGNSMKRLQEDTMTKMAVLGRGSMRNKQQEEDLRNSSEPKYAHLNDDLHVEITAFAPPSEAHARVAYALAEVRKYLIPDANDEIRQRQMREMEMINSSAATVVGSGKESDANDHAEGEGAVSAIITSDVNGNGVEGDAECATTEQQPSSNAIAMRGLQQRFSTGSGGRRSGGGGGRSSSSHHSGHNHHRHHSHSAASSSSSSSKNKVLSILDKIRSPSPPSSKMNGSINNGTAISNTCNSIASAPNNAGFVDCHSTAVAAAFVNGINFREDIVAANGIPFDILDSPDCGGGGDFAKGLKSAAVGNVHRSRIRMQISPYTKPN